MSEVQEKRSLFFNFDAGEVEFRGERAFNKGSVIFELPHEFRSPNFEVIQEIGLQVKNWLEDHLRDSPDILETVLSLLEVNCLSLAYITPEAYVRNLNDEINMRKGFWIATMGIIEWYTDDTDDEKTYRKDPNFKTMCRFFATTLYKMFNLEFSEKNELEIYVKEFGLFENYPKFYGIFYLWFDFSQEFYNDPVMKKLELNRNNMVLLGEAFEKQYISNVWMNGVGLEEVDTFHLYAVHRAHNGGGMMQITMAAIMDGFHKPELNYIFRDHHVEYFTFLSCMVPTFVHELLSLKKELQAGDTNNIVLMWLKKGMSLQESVNKTMNKHDQLLQKTQQLHNFLQIEYKNDHKALEYLNLVLKNFSGACQFQVTCRARYGHIKWSIDPERN